jgi:hypothetical protein
MSENWKRCFGDLPKEEQERLRGTLNCISRVVGLREEPPLEDL